MRTLIEKKLLEVMELQRAMQTQHLYHLKPNWGVLKSKEEILSELLSELDVQRAVDLQITINREIETFGKATSRLSQELGVLVDNFNELEGNAFIRLMEEAGYSAPYFDKKRSPTT